MVPAIVYVAGGGALGSVLRYLMSGAVLRLSSGAVFPYSTLTVNVLGSLVMGLWIGFMATLLPERARDLHLLFAVGVLGGFTTFSTFSLDVVTLLQEGHIPQAALYVLLSVAASMLALMAGLWIVRQFA